MAQASSARLSPSLALGEWIPHNNLFNQLYYVSGVVIAKSDQYISTYLFDQLYYVSGVVIAKSDQYISTYLFDQLYYVSGVVIAKSDE
ncbi:BQ5605_C117g13261 [Microbotryum silenes-dioicae]|uniref:BQ5605_C025g09954 protein n=1 Tax=Microbotryum silenes-dioicae TaxID=796604 RepID=A0A2X0MQU3_9BASI|nr:BQ5605_C025g09954 [Microbotryum silenes-dioicae]SGZ30154.1 BQ5605_C117g13261 [Microbotryum silenes-dioicae]